MPDKGYICQKGHITALLPLLDNVMAAKTKGKRPETPYDQP